MAYRLIDDDHKNFGLGFSPYVVGNASGCFRDGLAPDTLIAAGGCPTVSNFDVILPLTGRADAYYSRLPFLPTDTTGAIVVSATVNSQSQTVGSVLSGFSFYSIRDDKPSGVLDRSVHMQRVLNCLQNAVGDPVAVESPPAYQNSLSQNRPNPFNPTTTIEYSIAKPGHVSLKVYNVAGQLVKTLVDQMQSPTSVKPVVWDGRSDAGQPVASGVYFYKLTTPGFTQTKKMVMLK
jgi:hypothetical protein